LVAAKASSSADGRDAVVTMEVEGFVASRWLCHCPGEFVVAMKKLLNSVDEGDVEHAVAEADKVCPKCGLGTAHSS